VSGEIGIALLRGRDRGHTLVRQCRSVLGRRDQVLKDVGILESAMQQSFAVMLNDPSMPYDNAIEIRGEDCAYGRAKCGAISNAKPEDAAHAWIAFDTSNVAVEEVIPAGFVRCEIEDKICQDQGSTRDVKEQMLLEPR
jgi:hypothetical protein